MQRNKNVVRSFFCSQQKTGGYMLSIYNYKELHNFLKDAWLDKKRKNPAFSLSAWSRQLGFENSSPLSLALKGKRTLPKKYLPLVIKSLDLNMEEATYLENLFDLSKAKTAKEKLFYHKQLEQLSPQISNKTTVDEYRSLAEPIYGFILELTELKNFKTDPYWIQDRLRVRYDLFTISDAIQRLIKLNLLKVEESPRRFYKTYRNITTENDVLDWAAREFHQEISRLAGLAVQEQPLETREFQSFTFNLKKKDLMKAKNKIRKFIDNFLAEFESPPGQGDETYQLNVQLFAVTRGSGPGGAA